MIRSGEGASFCSSWAAVVRRGVEAISKVKGEGEGVGVHLGVWFPRLQGCAGPSLIKPEGS